MKNFIYKLLNIRGKRQADRVKLKEIHNILIFINDKSFHISDISATGVAIINQEEKMKFTVGKKYQAELEVFNQKKCPFEFKVVRNSGGTLGCIVSDNTAYKHFVEDFLKNNYFG
jgi:hypothetical protein